MQNMYDAFTMQQFAAMQQAGMMGFAPQGHLHHPGGYAGPNAGGAGLGGLPAGMIPVGAFGPAQAAAQGAGGLQQHHPHHQGGRGGGRGGGGSRGGGKAGGARGGIHVTVGGGALVPHVGHRAEGDDGGGGGAGAAHRHRNNEIGEPSRVIHMRNVTPEVSQLSIQNLVASFGRIRNVVMLRQKNQALVEMETLQSAQQMVDFFKDPGYAEIDGRRVYLRYSLHNELTASAHTSKALLVSMFNTQYDVSAAAQITPMIVFQIFHPYSPVEKIVVLPKNDSSAQNHNRVQALVQFETKEAAEQVKNMLQGQPVTLGETITFTLDLQFSRMDEIKTSSPHNSLIVPKNATPQSLLQQQAQQQQLPHAGGRNWAPASGAGGGGGALAVGAAPAAESDDSNKQVPAGDSAGPASNGEGVPKK